MRKDTVITALVIMVVASSSFVPSSLYAADKIGLGIDFYRNEKKSRYDNYPDNYHRNNDSDEFRLYYEHLLEQPVGIQFELGYAHSKYHDSDSYDYDNDRADLVGLLKYYFPLKGETSLYIGGGVGLTYSKTKTSECSEAWVNLIEQAAVGVQFLLVKNISVFVEDRFLYEISDGHLRVGLYINL